MINEKVNKSINNDNDCDSFNSVELTRKSYEEILSPEVDIPIISGKEHYIKIKKQKVLFHLKFREHVCKY